MFIGTVKEKWISKGIPSALKTRTKPKINNIIEKLKTLTEELEKRQIVADNYNKSLSSLNLSIELPEIYKNFKVLKS